MAADYEVPSSINSRLRRRSDGVSFISNSKQLALDANGNGPVSLAKQTGEEQVRYCREGRREGEGRPTGAIASHP